jgi:Competence protein
MLHTCEILSLSTVCWGATAPILIYQEHRLSLVAIFANLLVVPMATMVMFLAVAGLLAGTISISIAGCLNNTSWLLTKLILLILHAATLVPCHCVNVSPSSLLQPDHVTALAEGSEHVIHLHLKGHDWLINTGKLSKWRSLTEPYLQFRGIKAWMSWFFAKPTLTWSRYWNWCTASSRLPKSHGRPKHRSKA